MHRFCGVLALGLSLGLPAAWAHAEPGGSLPDRDGDGIANQEDNCPDWPNPEQADSDRNGRGDLCECGDQTGDGTVNVEDILAINRVIFELEPASPLCDTNADNACNIRDILEANRKIFGAELYCSRYPEPGSPDRGPRDDPAQPARSLLDAVEAFKQADRDASFGFFNGHVDRFSTAAKMTIPAYALPVLEQLGLPMQPVVPAKVPAPTHTDVQRKPARDLDANFDVGLPILPEERGEFPQSEGEEDRIDVGQTPPFAERGLPPEDPQQLFPWERPSDEILQREERASIPILEGFLTLNEAVFEISPNDMGTLVPVSFESGAFYRKATFAQLYGLEEPLLYGKTLVHFDANWNVIGISRMVATPAKLRIPDAGLVSLDEAILLAERVAPFESCAGRPLELLRAQRSVDPVRRMRVWDIEIRSLDDACRWRTIVDTVTPRVLNVSDEIDRFTDARVNRWYFPGGDQFSPAQIVSQNIYTRNDRRLEHDFFYMMNDHRCEGDPESECGETSFGSVWCDEAHGTTNGISYIRATRRTARDWVNYYPSGASETFGETNAYYWARSFSQWLKSSLDALGVLPNSASNYPRVLIISDACRDGSVHNSSYSVSTDDDKGEGTNVIRLGHRNPGASSNHNYGCQGGGCFDNPSNIAHELNHFFLKRYHGVGSGLDCGAANQLKFTHEGALGTAVPQAYWHYYYGIGYAPDTDRLYFSHSSIGRVHRNESTRMTIGSNLCVDLTDDPYVAGRVVGQALWEFYHGNKVDGSTISGTWYPSTDRDFNVLVYWAADLQSGSTYKDRYEFANRLMEILDKHSNWSSSGKQDYCEIFAHHGLDPFIDPDYCS